MSRYIDANTLTNYVISHCPDICFVNAINLQPTADVAKVVRCKDCVKQNTPYCYMWYECNCGERHALERDNDFCSYGKRKYKNG